MMSSTRSSTPSHPHLHSALPHHLWTFSATKRAAARPTGGCFAAKKHAGGKKSETLWVHLCHKSKSLKRTLSNVHVLKTLWCFQNRVPLKSHMHFSVQKHSGWKLYICSQVSADSLRVLLKWKQPAGQVSVSCSITGPQRALHASLEKRRCGQLLFRTLWVSPPPYLCSTKEALPPRPHPQGISQALLGSPWQLCA